MKSSKASELLAKINRAIENPQLSKLEVDLLKQHIRDLYEQVDSATAGVILQSEPVVELPKKEPETVVLKKPVMHTNNDFLLTEHRPAATKVNDFLKRAMVVAPEEKPVEEKPVVEEPRNIKVQNEATQIQAGSINESIKSSGSLNEKLKTSSVSEMHKKHASKPLKELIDLNKRFVILNELFKGNTNAYSAAIAHIDTLPDFDTALNFTGEQLATNYAWEESKQSTRMFMKLLRLKYGVE